MSRQLDSQVASPFQKSWGTSAILAGGFVSIGTVIVLGLILSGARAIAVLPVMMGLTIIVIGVIYTVIRMQWADKFDNRVEDFKDASATWMLGYAGVAVATVIAGLIMNGIGSVINTLHPSSLFWVGLLGVLSYAACIAVLSWSPRGGMRKFVVALCLGIGSQLMTLALAAQQAWLDAGHFMN